MSHKIVKFQVFLNVSNVPISRQYVSHIYGKFQENDHAPFLIIAFLEVYVREEENVASALLDLADLVCGDLCKKRFLKILFKSRSLAKVSGICYKLFYSIECLILSFPVIRFPRGKRITYKKL